MATALYQTSTTLTTILFTLHRGARTLARRLDNRVETRLSVPGPQEPGGVPARVAVGMRVTSHPPHRPVLALLTHLMWRAT